MIKSTFKITLSGTFIGATTSLLLNYGHIHSYKVEVIQGAGTGILTLLLSFIILRNIFFRLKLEGKYLFLSAIVVSEVINLILLPHL